jgi:predicted deacylase
MSEEILIGALAGAAGFAVVMWMMKRQEAQRAALLRRLATEFIMTGREITRETVSRASVQASVSAGDLVAQINTLTHTGVIDGSHAVSAPTPVNVQAAAVSAPG